MAITLLQVNTTADSPGFPSATISINANSIYIVSTKGANTRIEYVTGDETIKSLLVTQSVTDIYNLASKHLIKVDAAEVKTGAPKVNGIILLNATRVMQVADATNPTTTTKDWAKITYDYINAPQAAFIVKSTRASVAKQILDNMAGAGVSTVAINDTFVVANQAARLASAAAKGDVAVQTDTQESYILQQTPATTNGNWVKLLFPASVTSVEGLTGAVVLPTASTSAKGLVKIAAYPGGLRDNGLGELEADPNVVPKLVNGLIPTAYLPAQPSTTGSTRDIIRLGAATISHPLNSGTGRSIYAGMADAIGYPYVIPKNLKVHRVFISTNIISLGVTQINGMLWVEQNYKVGSNPAVTSKIQALNPSGSVLYPNPFATVMDTTVQKSNYSIAYDIPQNNPPVLEKFKSNLELYIDILGIDPATGGLVPGNYTFEVYIEVEYV